MSRLPQQPPRVPFLTRASQTLFPPAKEDFGIPGNLPGDLPAGKPGINGPPQAPAPAHIGVSGHMGTTVPGAEDFVKSLPATAAPAAPMAHVPTIAPPVAANSTPGPSDQYHKQMLDIASQPGAFQRPQNRTDTFFMGDTDVRTGVPWMDARFSSRAHNPFGEAPSGPIGLSPAEQATQMLHAHSGALHQASEARLMEAQAKATVDPKGQIGLMKEVATDPAMRSLYGLSKGFDPGPAPMAPGTPVSAGNLPQFFGQAENQAFANAIGTNDTPLDEVIENARQFPGAGQAGHPYNQALQAHLGQRFANPNEAARQNPSNWWFGGALSPYAADRRNSNLALMKAMGLSLPGQGAP